MQLVNLTRGYEAMVDDDDYDKVIQYNWSTVITVRGIIYAKRGLTRTYDGVPRKYQLLHHFILPLKDGFTVDHKDRNGLNNQKNNLRYATTSQQMANRKGPNPYGYNGIRPLNDGWIARIRFEGKEYSKAYRIKEEAARGYDKLAKQFYGEFAYLNFPEKL